MIQVGSWEVADGVFSVELTLKHKIYAWGLLTKIPLWTYAPLYTYKYNDTYTYKDNYKSRYIVFQQQSRTLTMYIFFLF